MRGMLRNGWRTGAAVCLVGLQAAASLAWAQQAAGGGTSQAGAEADDTVTVIATRNPRPAFEYPGQVSVIDTEEIETFAPSDLDDLLRMSPGVEVLGGPRRTGQTIGIRGLGRENVLILIDGARQSFISQHDGRVFLDPELLRSVEVLRDRRLRSTGPAHLAALWPSRPHGRATSWKRGQSVGYRLRVGAESAADEQFAVGSVFGRSGALDGLLSLGGRRSGDISLANNLDLPADDDIATWLGNAGVKFEGLGELRLSTQGFRNVAIEPNNGQDARLGGGTGQDADVKKVIDTQTWRLGGRLKPAGAEWIDADILVYQADTFVNEQELLAPRRVLRDITTTGVSLDNRTRFNLGPANAVLTIGADWWRDEQVGRDTSGPAGTRDGVPDGQSEFTGAYAQVELDSPAPFGAPGRVSVIPGVRFDHYENSAVGEPLSNQDDQVSGRIAANWAPTESFFVYGSWSQGFRTPSVNELYLDGIHFSITLPPGPPGRPRVANNVFTPNVNLRPETSETLEGGFGIDQTGVFTATDRLRLKAGYWRSDVTDLINIQVIGGGPISTCFIPPRFSPCNAGTTESQNVADAELDGIEAELSYQRGALSLMAAYSTIDGQDSRTNQKVGILTPARLMADARYSFVPDRLAMGVRAEFADRFDKVNTPTELRDGYALVDVYATWRPYPNVRVDAGIDNVFDKLAERVFAGVAEPGRSARIAVSWSGGF
jgi:hemoglobin/transferrin/lactoferrin receptor protein